MGIGYTQSLILFKIPSPSCEPRNLPHLGPGDAGGGPGFGVGGAEQAVVRKRAEFDLPKVEALVSDFERWADLPDGPALLAEQLGKALGGQPSDAKPLHAFCCLGTTIKTAGSQAAFQRVDLDYVAAFAQAMRQLGAAHLGVISSLGASAASSAFYLRTKGAMEAAVAAAGLPSTHFVRPSLIDGNRAEVRTAESLGMVAARLLAPVMLGPARKYRMVHADPIVARLIAVAAQASAGLRVTESQAI